MSVKLTGLESDEWLRWRSYIEYYGFKERPQGQKKCFPSAVRRERGI